MPDYNCLLYIDLQKIYVGVDSLNIPKKLEEEAVTDPCIKLVYRGKICRIPKAKLNGFVKELAGGIERRIEEQKNGLREEDYLKLLTAYEGWLKGGEKHGFLGI